MSFQAWQCEVCGTHGKVRYEKHAGVWEVIQALSAAHRRKDGDCADKHGLEFVRVANPAASFGVTREDNLGKP